MFNYIVVVVIRASPLGASRASRTPVPSSTRRRGGRRARVPCSRDTSSPRDASSSMPWFSFASAATAELDEDVRARIIDDPSSATTMRDLERVPLAAAQRSGELALERGECAHAAAYYALALRVLAKRSSGPARG